MTGELDETNRHLLDIAGRDYRHPGSLETAVHDELGLSLTRYLQRLNRLVDDPAAWAYAPATVKRLRRITRR